MALSVRTKQQWSLLIARGLSYLPLGKIQQKRKHIETTYGLRPTTHFHRMYLKQQLYFSVFRWLNEPTRPQGTPILSHTKEKECPSAYLYSRQGQRFPVCQKKLHELRLLYPEQLG